MSTVALSDHEVNKSNLQLFFAIFPATLASQVILMSVGVINAIMASHISVTAMASIALAGSIIWPLQSLGTGIISVQLSKMGFALGKNDYRSVGYLHRQAYWLVAGVSLIIMGLLLGFALNLDLMKMDAPMQAIVKPYIMLSLINVPLLQMIMLFRGLNGIIAYTLPTLYTSILGLLLIVPLNWLFMFGHLPWLSDVPKPEYAALAQMCLSLVYLGVLIFLTVTNKKRYGKFKLFEPLIEKPNFLQLSDSIRIGLPVALQAWLENSFYGLVAVFLAHLGTIVVAAHEAAMTTYGAVFTVSVACQSCITSIASRRLGQRNRQSARNAFNAIMLTSLGFSIVVGACVYGFRYEIAAKLTNGHAEAIGLSTKVLTLLVFANVFDSFYCTICGYLIPFRDSKFTMWASLVISWVIYMPIACIISFTDWLGFGNFGIFGFWSIFIVIALTCFVFFLLRIEWRWHKIGDAELWRHLAKNESSHTEEVLGLKPCDLQDEASKEMTVAKQR